MNTYTTANGITINLSSSVRLQSVTEFQVSAYGYTCPPALLTYTGETRLSEDEYGEEFTEFELVDLSDRRLWVSEFNLPY